MVVDRSIYGFDKKICKSKFSHQSDAELAGMNVNCITALAVRFLVSYRLPQLAFDNDNQAYQSEYST